MFKRKPVGILPAVALVALALLTAGPARAEFEETHRFGSGPLTVNNLIGKVDVVGGSGSEIEVTVKVRGRDGTRDNIEIEKDGNELSVRFPIDGNRKYVYPELGRGRTTFSPDRGGDSWLGSVLGSLRGGKITVTGSGSGMQVWADIEIRVPSGRDVTVKLGVGKATAEDVSGDITLDTASGHVNARNVRGNLVADTGSGHVVVEDIDGDLLADTGSGHVEARRIRGGDVRIDTGSGHVEAEDIDCTKLVIDTGSGHVNAARVRADSALIDTGSGGITLELDRIGSGTYELDTGSGRIRLTLPRGASADVIAETGSGGIHLDLDEAVELRYKERDEVRFVIGGGAAKVKLDTGSGGISISDH